MKCLETDVENDVMQHLNELRTEKKNYFLPQAFIKRMETFLVAFVHYSVVFVLFLLLRLLPLNNAQ